jgi:hypothetical protein
LATLTLKYYYLTRGSHSIRAKYRNMKIFNVYMFGFSFLDPQPVGDCISNELAKIQRMNENLKNLIII